jgi:molybdopterin/thiamine biosynthesis adenylyltransferase
MYSLDNTFTRSNFSVTVIGCGGTGSFAADGLCRILPENADLVLVDHDRVEEANLVRQSFGYDELGKYKSEALAHRFAVKYRRAVCYSTLPVSMAPIKMPGLVVGCVDNGPARRDIADGIKRGLSPYYGFASWWVDAGNGEYYGQVLIGNTDGDPQFDERSEVCLLLPTPVKQRPDLLAEIRQERSCVQIAEQGPTINQAIGALVIEVVRRIIEGSCPWMQLYLDLKAGTLMPVFAEPETVNRVMGYKKRRKKGGEK